MRALGTIIGSLAIAAITISVGCVDSEPKGPGASDVGGKADDPEDWCHRRLSANDGVQMSVDYQVKDTSDASSFEMSATPVWLNVQRDDFGSHQEARAVVVERTWDNECGAHCRDNFSFEGRTHTVDLGFENGRFTAEIPSLVLVHHDNGSNGGGTSSLYELAVVVDGTWYKGTDGRNLRFIPTSFSGNCAH